MEMKLQTKIKFDSLEKKINFNDQIMSFGSCFSDEIGNKLKGLGFNIINNPFGVLYNPISIAHSLEFCKSNKKFNEKDIIIRDPYSNTPSYTSFYHHGSFARYSQEEFLSNANNKLTIAKTAYKDSSFFLITLGTSWVFRHIESNIIVSNCHKHQAKEFIRERLTVKQIVTILSPIIKESLTNNYDTTPQWIFTVSPIRHLKDGLHGNEISKATLLLAIEQLCEEFSNVHYFPSYEIMMDELRDYRFYNEDMIHPTPQAVNYIWENFKQYAINPDEFPRMKIAEKNIRINAHRPIMK